MRREDIEVVVAVVRAIHHLVFERWKSHRIRPVVRPVLTQPLGSKVYGHAQDQHLVGMTIIDRHPLIETNKAAQAGGKRLIKAIISTIPGCQDCQIEQRGIAIAIEEPVAYPRLQGPNCPCCGPRG